MTRIKLQKRVERGCANKKYSREKMLTVTYRNTSNRAT